MVSLACGSGHIEESLLGFGLPISELSGLELMNHSVQKRRNGFKNIKPVKRVSIFLILIKILYPKNNSTSFLDVIPCTTLVISRI